MTERRWERGITLWNFQVQKEATMKIEGWIETHPIQFSIMDLSAQLGVGEELCKRVVEASPLVNTIDGAIGKSGPQKKVRFSGHSTPPNYCWHFRSIQSNRKGKGHFG